MGHKTSEKTLDRLVGSETREDQFCWTFCLAELAKVAVDLVPDVVALAWPVLATRIRGVQPEESSTKSQYPLDIAKKKKKKKKEYRQTNVNIYTEF
jgi:hypothetical protein